MFLFHESVNLELKNIFMFIESAAFFSAGTQDLSFFSNNHVKGRLFFVM